MTVLSKKMDRRYTQPKGSGRPNWKGRRKRRRPRTRSTNGAHHQMKPKWNPNDSHEINFPEMKLKSTSSQWRSSIRSFTPSHKLRYARTRVARNAKLLPNSTNHILHVMSRALEPHPTLLWKTPSCVFERRELLRQVQQQHTYRKKKKKTSSHIVLVPEFDAISVSLSWNFGKCASQSTCQAMNWVST